MRSIFWIIIRKKGKDHCRTKVQPQHAEESGRTMDTPMKWVYDEFVDPKLSPDHKDLQLIPKESSSIKHKTPSSPKVEKGTIYYKGEEKGLIKNLPALKVLTRLYTVLESTQIKGPVRVIIRKRDSISKEKEGKLTLMKDPEKTQNLHKIIRNLHHIKGKGVIPL